MKNKKQIMKQTAVEWLINKMVQSTTMKGWIEIFEQAKEIEKEQLEKVWKASEQNMRSQFSSSQYKNVTFEEWLEKNNQND